MKKKKKNWRIFYRWESKIKRKMFSRQFWRIIREKLMNLFTHFCVWKKCEVFWKMAWRSNRFLSTWLSSFLSAPSRAACSLLFLVRSTIWDISLRSRNWKSIYRESRVGSRRRGRGLSREIKGPREISRFAVYTRWKKNSQLFSRGYRSDSRTRIDHSDLRTIERTKAKWFARERSSLLSDLFASFSCSASGREHT